MLSPCTMMLWWLVFCLSILNAAVGQSSEQDSACLKSFPGRFSWYPSQWKILLDSYGFDSLQDLWKLNPTTSNPYSQSGGVCSRSWLTCYATGDSWLFTQYISYNDAQQVFFNVTYDFGDCGFIPTCNKQYVTANIYSQSSKASSTDQIEPSNYVPLLGSQESSRLEQSARQLPGRYNILARDRPANDNGFNLGFKDEGTCGSIMRVIAYYLVCPKRASGLVRYAEVSVPPRSSPNSVYQARCTSHSHNVTSLDVLITSASSTCTDMAHGGARCECNGGYRLSSTTCEPCRAGTYRASGSPASIGCVVCPANTSKDSVAVAQCPCIAGYFRDVPHEGPAVGCTRPPNECTNLRVSSTGENTVVLQWLRPSIIGRADYYYKVYVSNPSRLGEFNLVNGSLVNTSSTVTYSVSNLSPFQTYRLRVTTHNNVSDQDTTNEHLRRCEVTATTREGVPSAVRNAQGFCSVIVWQPPAQTSGGIQRYELQFTQGATRTVTSTYSITTEDERNSGSSVQVRARNGAGAGPYSTFAIGCTDAMATPATCPDLPTLPPVACPSSTTPAHFELKGRSYLNNTVVLMEDIGVALDALLCVSDVSACCSTGEFFYPNGSKVPIGNLNYAFYRNRGRGLGFIRLNRRSGPVDSPLGRYQCVIPSSNGKTQTLYINIVSSACSDRQECLECATCTTATPPPVVCLTCPTVPPPLICSEPTTPPELEIPTPKPTTPKPAEETTQKPEERTTPAPEEPTTPAPEETTTPAPEETTTPAPEETTTPAPEETTTPEPEETTTPEPEEITTPEPEETTTPATEVITTPSSIPGFYFSLRGRVYNNNSVMILEDVGEVENALLCVSEDNPFCCNRVGEFYYPNETKVPVNNQGYSFWRNRGKGESDNFIRLNQRPNTLSADGIYRCKIPYGTNLDHNLYISLESRNKVGAIQALSSSLNGCPNNKTIDGCIIPAMIAAGATFLSTTIMGLTIVMLCIIRYKTHKKLDNALSNSKRRQVQNVCRQYAPNVYSEGQNGSAGTELDEKI